MTKDKKYLIVTSILGIFLPFFWLISIYLFFKSKEYKEITYKQIINNIILIIISFLIAIFPIILQITSVYWDPRFSAPGSGAPLGWLMYFSVPIAIGFLFISIVFYNIFCCIKRNK